MMLHCVILREFQSQMVKSSNSPFKLCLESVPFEMGSLIFSLDVVFAPLRFDEDCLSVMAAKTASEVHRSDRSSY